MSPSPRRWRGRSWRSYRFFGRPSPPTARVSAGAPAPRTSPGSPTSSRTGWAAASSADSGRLRPRAHSLEAGEAAPQRGVHAHQEVLALGERPALSPVVGRTDDEEVRDRLAPRDDRPRLAEVLEATVEPGGIPGKLHRGRVGEIPAAPPQKSHRQAREEEEEAGRGGDEGEERHERRND